MCIVRSTGSVVSARPYELMAQRATPSGRARKRHQLFRETCQLILVTSLMLVGRDAPSGRSSGAADDTALKPLYPHGGRSHVLPPSNIFPAHQTWYGQSPLGQLYPLTHLHVHESARDMQANVYLNSVCWARRGGIAPFSQRPRAVPSHDSYTSCVPITMIPSVSW